MLQHLLVSAALVAAALVAAPPALAQGPDAERVLVVLHDAGSTRTTADDLARQGATVHHEYSHVLSGFAATVPAGRLDALRRDPRVRSVVPDGLARPDDHVGTPWGLDRIDQRQGPGDGAYTRDTDGAGVTAYVIDSGIRTTHRDFGGRARWGVDLVDGTRTDCTGHGTHVAGTIGGATYGVAPAAELVAVRVFGCSHDVAASWSTIIAGLDWVVAHRSGPSVVNMSLSGLANPAMDEAVARATAAGVSVVVTAGNDGYDACQKSPARAPSALTVGATQRTDARAASSNSGPCVDLFAPGVDIPSASTWDDAGHWLSSGTSMAAAHVSGAVARSLQTHPAAGAAQVAGLLLDSATPNAVLDSRSPSSSLLHLPPQVLPTAAAPAAPGAPQTVSAAMTGATTATLRWQAPAHDGGSPVTAYVLSGCSSAPRAVGPSPLEATLTALAPGTTCTASVAAVNALGTGPVATVALRVPAPPTAPQSLAVSSSTRTITASWQPPASNGGADVIGYVVTVRDTRTGTTDRHDVNGSTTSVSLPVTSRRTAHQVEVRAVTVAGPGAPATASTTTK